MIQEPLANHVAAAPPSLGRVLMGGALSTFLVLSACQRAPPETTVTPTGESAAGHPMQMPATMSQWSQGAQLFDRLGPVHRRITTRSADAQRYFDQGLSFMWGFNHDEATRSFAKAAELDPHCASCFWAVALTVGPNYNLPFLTEQRARVALQALGKAQREAVAATPVEQALIAALASRYPDDKPLDAETAGPVHRAYAAAMKAVADRFPDDLDVQTLYAESLMNVHAWKLWKPDGSPTEGTPEIVATLESVLKRDPQHVGANHYYIHVVEASPHPELALPAAERLRTLVPGAGHLVHMPAHIYQRLGRYGDAAEANRRAAVEDAAYMRRTMPPDYYPMMYAAHNYQFLAYSAAMAGRKKETLEAVDHSRAVVSDALLLQMPGMDWYVAESYLARVRFGLWPQILVMPAPDERLLGLVAGYLYARAVAHAATGDLAAARADQTAFAALSGRTPPDAGAGQNLLTAVLAVGTPLIEARIADNEHRGADEIAQLRLAVAAEDRLGYDEPPNWFVPSRQVLGAALLRLGDAKAAEAVYREDLARNPANGWGLFGLRAALEAQHRGREAAEAGREFKKIWQSADIELIASAY